MSTLRLIGAAALSAAVIIIGGRPGVGQDRSELPQGVEVVMRGPVHEGYAEPGEAQAEEFIVVPQQPPDPIEEMPPDQRPAGDEIVWIPGYWAWDEEAHQFLWVSGFWRKEPPGRHWVPGFWQQVEGGWHRVSGFWASDESRELTYLPPPPEPIAESPPPAPDATSVYVPGTWFYNETRYVWRPGFWVGYRPGWVYTPSRYFWTPGGWLFVDGYWDYPLHHRGLLFAPLRVSVATLPRFRYVPTYAIYPDTLLTSLFVRPASRTYFFGDYFDNRYVRAGYIPWVDYRLARNVYDPNFAYYRQTFRENQRWENDLRTLYVNRLEGRAPRPPVTLAQQAQLLSTTGNARVGANALTLSSVRVAAPLEQINNARLTLAGGLAAGAATARATESVLRLQPVSADVRQRVVQSVTQSREFSQSRQRREQGLIRDTDDLRPGERPRTVPLERRAPGTAGRAAREGDRAVPPAPRVPQPDASRTPPDRPRGRALDRPDVDRPRPGDRDPVDKGRPTIDPRDLPGKDRPKVDPRVPPAKDRPKVEPPNRDRPPVDPRSKDRPNVDPRPIPAKDRPKVEPPDRDRPKVDPRDRPKIDPTDRPRIEPPDRPKVDPRDRPKVEPPDRPRVDPRDVPRADRPPTTPPRPIRPGTDRPKSERPAPPPPKDRSKEKQKDKDGGR